MTSVPLVDIVLGLTLAGIAVRALTASDLFQAIVLFIVFGLLMAVAWTRLHAVDVALAEAAIGAGLTGALFLNALGPAAGVGVQRPGAWRPWLFRLPLLALAAWFAVTLAGAPAGGGGGLRSAVGAEIARSGASNPVTAVLLNFRAYDTMLEVAVLILAVSAVWALGPPQGERAEAPRAGPILLLLVRVLIPFIAVVAGYLLWIGTAAPGGAFQAGAVLGGAGILLVVSGLMRGPSVRHRLDRLLAAAGFVVFLAVGLGVLGRGGRLLEYRADSASTLILLIETVLTLSIATILVALFAGSEAAPSSGTPAAERE